MARRKKVTLKLIENFVARKARYRKIRENLLKKVEDVTTLCDVNACAIIYGPGDDVPTVWPSHDIAKELLDKFENAPLPERLKKNVTPQLYIDQMNRKIEKQVMKLKKKNDEKDMSNFLHNIHDGKSLSDLDASDICRLLCYVEGKLKCAGVKVHISEQQLSTKTPTPLVSFPLQNDIDSCANIDEQVFQQQSSLDSTKETGPMNSDSDNNKNTGLPPLQQHAHDNTGLSQVNFESLNLDDIGMVLHSANFNDVIDDNGLAFGMLAQDNYIGICDNGDLGLLHGSSSGGEITGNDIWSSYESFGDISESDTMLPFNNNVQDNIDGTFMGANVENEGVSINNIELSGDQRTTSGDT
ncbi:agamous-like MADS-box protein AGL90 [Vigna umbellata]|uniref:agamous-like MADS-box protein AGL90 n=1 Tax=Vigna umbellata TaxID=87088 RepID=UPI001F5F0354|nr:agamous-like MADS-box protein AGL90 [Vigna umbellata]